MSQGLFITGTDTEVGKTVVTAVLAAVLAGRGLRVGVMKPAESGCPVQDGQLVPPDAMFLREAAACSAPLELVNPYRFAPPVTPALAAELAGVTIEIAHIQACYAQLAATHDIVLVEGAGGLLAPLTAEWSMHDLATALQLPILIVARNILGVINHTALTVTVARQTVPVIGIILNDQSPNVHPAEQSNADSLRRWGRAPLLGRVPYTPTLERNVLQSLGNNLDIDALLQALGAPRS
jgi:dethiobiotin synthetase